MPRSIVAHDDFDWGDDTPMFRRWRDTVIYELHVKGFTQLHPQIPPGLRGTPGAQMYIAYLRDPDGNKICALHRVPR